MIHAKGLRTFILFATLAACCFSFLGAGCPPPGLRCEAMITCPDGQSVEVCLSPNETQCGYKVGLRWFPCASCSPNLDCEAAALKATELCYGNLLSEDSSFTDLEVDEAVIEEFTEDFLDAMDDLKESY